MRISDWSSDVCSSDLAPDDWTGLTSPVAPELGNKYSPQTSLDEDTTDSERRHQPELSRAKAIEIKAPIENEFEIDPVDSPEEDVARNSRLRDTMRQIARQAPLDPGDGIALSRSMAMERSEERRGGKEGRRTG